MWLIYDTYPLLHHLFTFLDGYRHLFCHIEHIIDIFKILVAMHATILLAANIIIDFMAILSGVFAHAAIKVRGHSSGRARTWTGTLIHRCRDPEVSEGTLVQERDRCGHFTAFLPDLAVND